MVITEAFSCLGIPVTTDSKAIKKAYQKIIPLHHPEEDPEGFQRIHQAYKTALDFAQDKKLDNPFTAQSFRRTEPFRSSPEETAYDSLFSSLDAEPAQDPAQLKKNFSRKLLGLKLHWLPIPLKRWKTFFGSECYLLCRKDPDCLSKLYDLLLRKIHTYPVLHYLINQLWELDVWLRSEDEGVLSSKTRSCIEELKKQYSHYLKLSPDASVKKRILPAFWYYQALPFYFKQPVSLFLLPLLTLYSLDALMALILVFYILEAYIWVVKRYHNLGIFYPTLRRKKGILQFTCTGDNGWLIVATIYAILFHFFLTLAFWDNITSWL